MPTGIENLANLNSLTSYYNKLSGSLPTSICKPHKLQEVGICKNKLPEKNPFLYWKFNIIEQALARAKQS